MISIPLLNMRFILAVTSMMMIVFAAEQRTAAAFRTASASFGIIGGSSGRLRRSTARTITSITRSTSTIVCYSLHSNSSCDGSAHGLGAGSHRNSIEHARRPSMVQVHTTTTRLHMSGDTTSLQEDPSSTTTLPPPPISTTSSYPFATVEAKWQSYWKEHKTFATPSRRSVNPEDGTVTRSTNKKKYVLDMFPYPSGAGLHVGHPEGYTGEYIDCLFR